MLIIPILCLQNSRTYKGDKIMKIIRIVLICVCLTFLASSVMAAPMFRRTALKRIYPNLVHGVDNAGAVLDYHVLNRQNDGSETIIWNNQEPQPTEQEMQTAYDEAIAEKEAKALKKTNAETDIKASPWWQKTDAFLNAYINDNWSDNAKRKAMFKILAKEVADHRRQSGLDD